MTTSRSDVTDASVALDSIGKWPWSIVPTRAFGDKRLIDADRRVLGALCAFVNRAGVCWPSLETISGLAGYATSKSAFDAIARLKKAGYVRQLKPKDYQITASGWKTSRYQVLWSGDEPLPSLEEINAAAKLQLESLAPDNSEEKGSGDQAALESVAHTLAVAFARAVEARLGQPRDPGNEMGHARKLAASGVTAPEVYAAAVATCDEWLKRRAGVPSLGDVASRLAGHT
jgi:hypothetical protein